MSEPLHPAGSTPVPDPTLLTTAALTREISALKELVVTRLDAMDKAQSLFETNLTRVPTDIDKQLSHLKELHASRFIQSDASIGAQAGMLGTRLDGMDKAVTLIQDIADKFPARIDEKIRGLKDVHEEKFSSIQVQFRERDVRSEQSSKDSKVAVDAALQAAKEAVGEQNKSSALAISKSEASTIKQIDQMNVMIQAGFKSVDDKFDDIKERITRIEGKDVGVTTTKTTTQATSSFVVAIIGLVIGAVLGFYGISHPSTASATPPQVVYVAPPK
jgi:hypothetical protein